MDIYLDFETRSELDLKTVGAFKYFEHPSTDVLCLSYKTSEDEQIKIWEPAMIKHLPLWRRISQKNIRLHAWNATFDLLAWEHIMHGRYDWPLLPDHLWYDVQAVAVSKGYPADLESAAPALGLTERKLSGTPLIKLFSSYDLKKGGFTRPHDEPEKWQDFLTYCVRDTEVMIAAHNKLGDLPPKERDIWLHTLKINRRGVSIDSGACRNVIGLIDQKKEILDNGIAMHTGGEITKVTQRARIQKWLTEKCGVAMQDMQGTTVETALDVLADSDNPKHREAKILLGWYAVGNKSSTAKYRSMLNYLCFDRTVKGFLFYHGAGTGRYSGRGVQFQNFPNKTVDNADEVIDCLHEPDLGLVEITVGDILALSKMLLRSMIIAPSGKFLCVADYKSIEMVAVAWTCSEKEILNAFIKGLDQYRLMASKMYGVPYEQVVTDQRFAGKIAVLACGFGGGENAILGMATKMRMKVSEEQARLWTGQFRQARPALKNAWYETERTAKRAITGKDGELHQVKGVRGLMFTRNGHDLQIVLPSGRRINYPGAVTMSEYRHGNREIAEIMGIKESKPRCTAIKAWWVDSTTHQWKVRDLYGSLLFQNFIQGLCRDILAEAQLRLERRGFPVCINVHDELGSLVDKNDEYTFNQFRSIMTQRPDWLADDFPVLADGYIAKRYRK